MENLKNELTTKIEKLERRIWNENMADFLNRTLVGKLEKELRAAKAELAKLN